MPGTEFAALLLMLMKADCMPATGVKVMLMEQVELAATAEQLLV